MAGLFVLSAVGCGGGDDDDAAGAFTATEPPDDVCGMLDHTDVATLLPNVDRAMPDQVQATADIWVRSCTYASPDSALASVDLVLEGAISKAGSDLIHSVVAAGPGDGLTQHVDGVGETATYWANDDFDTLGLLSAWHGYAVGVTAYYVDPPPTKDQLVPLVVKVIGKLP
jgi:hypothetical protein